MLNGQSVDGESKNLVYKESGTLREIKRTYVRRLKQIVALSVAYTGTPNRCPLSTPSRNRVTTILKKRLKS